MEAIERDLSERRHAIRRAGLVIASISFQNGNCSMECVVLDWSDYGARIQPKDIVSCPDNFTITTNNGSRIECFAVWRHDERMGVKFI